MRQILVLCIGNICRSPMAEQLLARELPGQRIWSAGLSALVGEPADPLAVEVAQAHGLDLSAHRAQQFTTQMCQSADLILVMERNQQSSVEKHHPCARGKVFRLGHIGNFEITDPYRLPRPAFEAAYELIARGVADWAPRIRKLG